MPSKVIYRIADALRASGKTQTELASFLGIQTHNVSNWCRGIYNPSDRNLARICEFLGCSISDIVFIDNAVDTAV